MKQSLLTVFKCCDVALHAFGCFQSPIHCISRWSSQSVLCIVSQFLIALFIPKRCLAYLSVRFYFKLMLVINPSPNIQAAEHPLSAVCYCLFKASVAALCLRMWSVINHLRSVLTANTVAFGIRKCILSTDGLDPSAE